MLFENYNEFLTNEIGFIKKNKKNIFVIHCETYWLA